MLVCDEIWESCLLYYYKFSIDSSHFFCIVWIFKSISSIINTPNGWDMFWNIKNLLSDYRIFIARPWNISGLSLQYFWESYFYFSLCLSWPSMRIISFLWLSEYCSNQSHWLEKEVRDMKFSLNVIQLDFW